MYMTVNPLTSADSLSWAQFREVEKSPDGTSMAQTASLMQPATIRIGKAGQDTKITQIQINVSVNAGQSWVVSGIRQPRSSSTNASPPYRDRRRPRA